MALHEKNLIAACALLLAISVLTVPAMADSQTVRVDPEASKYLEVTLDYLGKLDKFSVHTLNTFEEILDPGEKVQLDFAATLTVQRPAKMCVERHGEVVDQIMYYDGKMMTLYDTSHNYYAQTPAPDSIEAMLNFARMSLGLEAPASDLLYRDVFPLIKNPRMSRKNQKTRKNHLSQLLDVFSVQSYGSSLFPCWLSCYRND